MLSSTVPDDAGFRVDHRGALLTVTLDRPDRLNAQSPTMWSALARLRRDLPGDVRVVVIRATGRAFSAGLDRALFAPGAPDGVLSLARLSAADAGARIAAWQDAFDWSGRADLISVAAVQGHAVGAGFQLALGCDIRVLADDAQFTMAEPRLGLVPDLGGTKRLVDLVGVSRATEICLTGRRVGADEAGRIGLASHVVPAEGLGAAVDQLAAALLEGDRAAQVETKALLTRAASRTQSDQQEAERTAQYRLLRARVGFDAEDAGGGAGRDAAEPAQQ